MTIAGRRGYLYLAFKLAVVVLTVLAIELIVRLAVRTGRCHLRVFQVANRAEDIRFVGDLNPHFGAWHRPLASVTVNTPRGRISYEANSYGMRDRPRSLQSTATERVVVIGDSFVEGIHVDVTDRVTDILEKLTGVEFLNFGTSGGFGTIQEWLLYQHLALRFDHSRVFIFLLPDNDFSDNDRSKHSSDRYRPYLRKVGGSYKVYYPIPFPDAAQGLSSLSRGRRLRHRLYNNWYSLNLLVQWKLADVAGFFRSGTPMASYDDFSPEDLAQVLFTYGRILELAEFRPVTVFVIPRDKDFAAHEAGQFRGRIIAALSKFAASHDRLEVVDLMPAFLAYMKEHDVSYETFFLGFDPHWSPLGNRVAAEAVLASLRGSDQVRWSQGSNGIPAPRALPLQR